MYQRFICNATNRLISNITKSTCSPGQKLGLNLSKPQILRSSNRYQHQNSSHDNRAKNLGFYVASAAVSMFAVSFISVPLYKLFCQVTGRGGQAIQEDQTNKIKALEIDRSRTLTIQFVSSNHSSMPWNFVPVQDKITVHPGETALAFYRVTNPLDEPVIGVATYNILPFEAGTYFHKIQCFCFEEQLLRPKEDVFMPVLFYIDPEFSKHPQLGMQDELTLSYTFFRSKDGELVELD